MSKVLTAMCIALNLTLAAAAWGQTASADTPSSNAKPPSTTQVTTGQPDSTKGGQVTLSGCLATGSTTGQYKLTQATQVGMKEKGTVQGDSTHGQAAATAATKDSAMAGDSRMSYELISGSTDLKPHVGHKVEVTGTVAKDTSRVGGAQPDPMKSDKAGQTPPKTTGQGTQASQQMAQSAKTVRLTVTSVKHVSPTCP